MIEDILCNKNVLITGATGGIGKSLCCLLVQHRCNVFITGRNEEKLRMMKNELGSRCMGYKVADFQHVSSIASLIADANNVMGNIDILINSAGVFQVRSINDSTLEVFDECFNVNIRAPFLLSAAFADNMKYHKWGRIVNIGSSSAYAGFENTSIYCASKHALLGLSRSFHAELKKYGVRVFSISPGSVQTDMGKQVVGQDYATFINPDEFAKFIVHAISYNDNMIAEEIKINRMIMQ